MNGIPTVSVVVASYNYQDLVIETLESLWAQTCRDFEIVVVDDGSSDDSVANIRRFIEGHAGGDVPMRLVLHDDGANHGLPATVERGIRESKGEFVAFCESDDLWTPDHLEQVLQAVRESDGGADIVVNGVEVFGDPARCARFARIVRSRQAAMKPGCNRFTPAAFRDLNYIVTFSCAMVRRAALADCDFHPVARNSALDWWLWRQLCYNRPVWFVDKVLTRWRMHASQMVQDHSNVDFRERQRAFLSAGTSLLRRRHPITSLWRLVRSVPADPVRWRKRLRGFIKRLAPYAIQRAYAERTYGIFFPSGGSRSTVSGRMSAAITAVLPFGLVCRLKGLDPDNGVSAGADASGRQPVYRMSRARLALMKRERTEGVSDCADMIARNKGRRIAVFLHLFYNTAWLSIRHYLDNLSPYDYDLIVTATEGRVSDEILQEIRDYSPKVRIIRCENRGYDLWPFIKAMSETDLSQYDVVFKLHSKGVARPFLFMYGQIFKRTDWFYNLFDGVLGGLNVHRAIDLLACGEAKLVAAENLIIEDPKHKQQLVAEFCKQKGLSYQPGYRFVAGTCFAVRPEVLLPLKELGLKEDDFEPVRRGVFSTAHGIERWMCFAACGSMHGLPVRRKEYAVEVERCRETSPLRLLDDPRFDLDPDFFYKAMETRRVAGYDVVKLRLGDIRRRMNDGRIVTLSECEPYRYLQGNQEVYESYCETNRVASGFEMSTARFEALRASMTDFNPRWMPVVRNDENIVIDGQHRCCVLLDRYGPDHEVEVVKIW